MVLSGLEVLGKEAVRHRRELLVAGIPLTFVPGITHLRNTQPFILCDLRELPLEGTDNATGLLLTATLWFKKSIFFFLNVFEARLLFFVKKINKNTVKKCEIIT